MILCMRHFMPACLFAGMKSRRHSSTCARKQEGRIFRLRDGRKSCYGSCMIIVIANSKGGVGKSTLAVHPFAVWLHEQGHRKIPADCDTQQSSSEWIREAAPAVPTVCLHNPDMILTELPALHAATDYIIADGPGSQTETSRALLLRADLAIVPAKASMLEVRALAQATEVLRVSQDIRGGYPKAIAVLSMVGKTYRLTADMIDAAAVLNLPLASQPMTLRQVYADAPGQGKVVWHIGARARDAANEVTQIFCVILPEAARSRPIGKGKAE